MYIVAAIILKRLLTINSSIRHTQISSCSHFINTSFANGKEAYKFHLRKIEAFIEIPFFYSVNEDNILN